MTIPYPSLDTGHSGLSMASSYHYPSISQHKAPASSSLPSSQPPSLGLYHQVPSVPTPTPDRLCLPPPSPGLYNSVTHHPAPSTSAPPTPASGSQGGYGGYNHKGEGPRKPGGADLHHLQQHHHHQHQSYQAFNSFPHSTGRVLKFSCYENTALYIGIGPLHLMFYDPINLQISKTIYSIERFTDSKIFLQMLILFCTRRMISKVSQTSYHLPQPHSKILCVCHSCHC